MNQDEVQSVLHTYGYRVLTSVGSGSFSTCYLVVDEKYNQEFICKVLAVPPEPNKALTLKKSYYNEVNALVECIHPNVIKIYNHFIEQNVLFIILEYCKGGSLDKIIESHGTLKEMELFKYIKQFATGLAYCHSLGIANHDLKPANLLLDEFGNIRIADFGFATVHNYLTSECNGSLVFMPPEKINKQDYNPFCSDVWSFGITVYYLATGKYPFTGMNSKEVKRSILGTTYTIPNTVPSFAKKIITNTIVLKPADRWTMNDVVKYIRSVQGTFINRHRSTSELVLKGIIAQNDSVRRLRLGPRLSSLNSSTNDDNQKITENSEHSQ